MESTIEKEKEVTYDIQVGAYDFLLGELEKLNKKARKFGCPEAKATILREFLKPHTGLDADLVEVQAKNKWGAILPDQTVPHYRHYEVKVDCAPVCESGWTLLGCLDRVRTPDRNDYSIVRSVPGHEIPVEYRDKDQCLHCNKKAQRKTTYILEHEDGRTIQVGSTCLRDFLGADPLRIVWAANFNSKVTGIVARCDHDNHIHLSECYPAEILLAHVSASIRQDGWLSRGQAYAKGYEGGATADQAVYAYLVTIGRCKRPEGYWPPEVNDEDRRVAAESIQWARSISEGEINEYLYSIRTVAQHDWIDIRTLGVGCSIVSAYLRVKAQDIKRREKSLAVKDSGYIGEIKERLEITVKCLVRRSYDSDWGSTLQHQLVTPEGDSVIWWCSGSNYLDEGSTYRVKATVKKHEEYNGVKQTTLLRVKIIENLNGEQN